MNCNPNDDDCSVESRRSFPSLNRIYSQEEENNHIGLITIGDDSISQASSIAIACGMIVHPESHAHADDGHAPRSSLNLVACEEIHPTENYVDVEDGSTLDGYPTDEKTIQSMWSWAPTKENQRQRLNILDLARKSLARKKTETNSIHCISNDVAANVNTRDVENQATLKTTQGKDDEKYVFGFSFLTNINGEEVEEQPDDTSFIVGAGVEDVTGDIRSIRSDGTQHTSNTMYDIRASTMSRATVSTKASFISKELKLASQTGGSLANAVDEDQSMNTYSYGRAFADTGTVTQASNYVSTISALTDDNSHIRRTGMGEAINASPQCSVIHEHPSFDTSYHSPLRSDSFSMNKTVYSRPVDADTGTFITKSSHETSVARPPQATNSFDYENPDHLARMLSYGEGQSNVSGRFDETYRTTNNNNGMCCSWIKSSSRLVKLCVIMSIILSLVSIASLTLALLLPEQMKSFFYDSNFGRDERNGGGSELNGITPPTSIMTPTIAPSSLTCESRKWYSVKSPDGTKKRCSNGYRENVEESSKFDSLDQCCDALYKKIANCMFENVCIFSDVPTLFPTAAPNDESGIMILTLEPTPGLESNPLKDPANDIMTMIPSSMPSSLPPVLMQPSLRPSSPPKDPADDLSSLSPDSPNQTTSGGKVVRLHATADGTINHKFPDTNYGYSDELRVDSMPESWTIISFDMTDINVISQIQREIKPEFRAALRLYTLDQGESAQIYVRPIAQQWSETDLTWNNKDQLIDRSGELHVGSMEWVTGFAWNEVDVTAAFANFGSSDSMLTFIIRAESNDGITFASRKKDSGSFSPELVLTFGNKRTIGANLSLPNPPKALRTTSMPTYFPTEAPTLIEPK
jgi:hypothetical protein